MSTTMTTPTDGFHFVVDKDGPVTSVRLNRPQKRNAMNVAFFEGLRRVFDPLNLDRDCRVVLLGAEGSTFCAGLDLMAVASLPVVNMTDQSAANRADLLAYVKPWQEAINAVERCRKPVIAAVQGPCIGGGLDLVAAADIRLASADAVFSLREAAMALIADLGSLQRLPGIIGQSRTRELAFTARDVDAAEAQAMGLVSRVFDTPEQLLRGARELADRIARQSPLAVQGSKDVLNHSRDHGVEAGMHYALTRNSAMIPNEELLEALQAFMERRPPMF
jgi:enoyl-CoA hydratase